MIDDLLRRIDGMAYGADEYEVQRVLTEWQRGSDMSLIRSAVAGWLAESAPLDRVRSAARETSTHYVWPLYVGRGGHALAINEFKEPCQITVGYANTLHNHRYSFASLILSGGYGQVRSRVEIVEPGHIAWIHEVGKENMIEGGMQVVNHAEFHRLSDISSGTVTLLVKCPAAEEGSISVDMKTLRVSRHLPVESRIEELVKVLTATSSVGSAEGRSDARFA
jgi:hypothetical protein